MLIMRNLATFFESVQSIACRSVVQSEHQLWTTRPGETPSNGVAQTWISIVALLFSFAL